VKFVVPLPEENIIRFFLVMDARVSSEDIIIKKMISAVKTVEVVILTKTIEQAADFVDLANAETLECL